MERRNELLGEGPSRRRPPPRSGGGGGGGAVSPDDASGQQQQQIADLQAQQKAMLESAVKSSNQSVEMGHETNRTLNKQGEQLDRTNNKLDEVEYELKVSDKIVKNMSSLSGMVASWFWRTPKAPEHSTGLPQSSFPDERPHRDEQSAASRGAVVGARKTDIAQGEGGANDAYLDELDANINQMRDQALQQRRTMAEQNKKLDELATKVDNTNTHMRQTERNIRKI
eukprot:TRINITY_DN3568_c0_g1_i4.p1 TRINITY_DN3568_c0_g1~~TRINITY_DN3568_c0_g1_i4.p1  ORF type:complete len:226 (+),score=61.32 TRINITY_DN3568_c0_g1_i4:226-903(+)